MDELKLRTEFENIEPDELFAFWLDGEGHSAMTGSPATGSREVGGEFSAWDGYISGETLELDRPHRVVQSWRTTHFDEHDADSRLEVTFESNDAGGTIVTIDHTSLPDGTGEQYTKGWEEHYFEPMRRFFGEDAWGEEE